jgi:hypothetical protein
MFSKFFKANGKNASLHPLAFGVAAGIVWGAKILLGTWLAMMCSQAGQRMTDVMEACPYYSMSFIGSLIGFVWGFVRGFISFAVLAWVYNRLIK